MDEQSKRVITLFDGALREGWLNPLDLEVIRRKVGDKELSPERLDWLRRQLMRVLHGQARDEESKRLLAWAENVMRLLAPGTGQGQSPRVYFTPGNDCHKAVLGCLDAARSSLDICVFTITDDTITDRIREAAKRGVSVRIITDDQKASDPGSDIYLLAAAGLQVRKDCSPDWMHHKFAVVDDREVITGSFNWTTSSTHNYENILICGDPQAVLAYRGEFDRMWSIMEPVRTT